ncbi:ATP12 family chaperone protein [Roseitranquillus sediminis]|uniref:ATP12 family chaperone protein n=1 Tax=Roseitranquillus sediminis TaxID=2809051 RepID=UPI001D0C8181|nr:ATP12 family protein [Roseitranquillus sediminis]MBM9596353.1 ATPase [Roseitranquillus sediminis]
MSEWAVKRFWATASVRREGADWCVLLDERRLMTPGKRPLLLPTQAMASVVAEEWDRQREHVEPGTMPVTRAANAAIDKVAPQHAEVVQALAAYGETDLLCYRAETPEGLARRQSEAWDPLLEWSAQALGARLVPIAGVMPQPQPREAVARLAAQVEAMDAFALTAFHDLVMLSGSLVLGFAVRHRHLDAMAAWEHSRIDERWQAEQWGEDAEAAEAEAVRCEAFLAAERFDALAREHAAAGG